MQNPETRKSKEARRHAKEEAERREKYEAFLAQMMFELCEETALVFYPWVFRDEEGRYRDKYGSPPYTDLTTSLFKQNFDIQEEQRLHFTEETIESMLVESGVEVTKELIAGAFWNPLPLSLLTLTERRDRSSFDGHRLTFARLRAECRVRISRSTVVPR